MGERAAAAGATGIDELDVVTTAAAGLSKRKRRAVEAGRTEIRARYMSIIIVSV